MSFEVLSYSQKVKIYFFCKFSVVVLLVEVVSLLAFIAFVKA